MSSKVLVIKIILASHNFQDERTFERKGVLSKSWNCLPAQTGGKGESKGYKTRKNFLIKWNETQKGGQKVSLEILNITIKKK